MASTFPLAPQRHRHPITINEAGSGIIIASGFRSGSSHDKELSFAIDVLPKIKVLIVDGDEREACIRAARIS